MVHTGEVLQVHSPVSWLGDVGLCHQCWLQIWQRSWGLHAKELDMKILSFLRQPTWPLCMHNHTFEGDMGTHYHGCQFEPTCGALVVWPGTLFPISRGNKAAVNLLLYDIFLLTRHIISLKTDINNIIWHHFILQDWGSEVFGRRLATDSSFIPYSRAQIMAQKLDSKALNQFHSSPFCGSVLDRIQSWNFKTF